MLQTNERSVPYGKKYNDDDEEDSNSFHRFFFLFLEEESQCLIIYEPASWLVPFNFLPFFL